MQHNTEKLEILPSIIEGFDSNNIIKNHKKPSISKLKADLRKANGLNIKLTNELRKAKQKILDLEYIIFSNNNIEKDKSLSKEEEIDCEFE